MSGLEGIALLASFLQLSSQANSARKFISDCRRKIKNSPHGLDQIIKESQDEVKLIDSINWNTIPDPGLLQSITQRCTADLNALIKLLTYIRNTKGKKFRTGLIWKIRENEIDTILTNLERHKSSLHDLLSVYSFHRIEQIWSVQGEGKQHTQHLPRSTHQKKKTTISHLPPRNIKFIGQERRLLLMDKKLIAPGADVRLALLGLSGSGKSLLALEFAHRFKIASPDCSIFWIRANDELQLEQEFLRLANEANNSDISGKPNVEPKDATRWLESSESGSWLLVIDGIDEWGTFYGKMDLQAALPRSQNGRILFTSQNKKLMLCFLNQNSILQLDKLDYADAKALLQSSLEDVNATDEDVSALLSEMAYMPLAISQAASFIAATPTDIKEFLQFYREREVNKIEVLELIGNAVMLPHSTKKPMLVTWFLSFTRIQNEDEFAADLLSFISLLGCQCLPIALLPLHGSPMKRKAALGVLQSYSMISIDKACEVISTHPLVRLCTREYLRSAGLFTKFYTAAYTAVYDKIPKTIQGKDDLTIAEPLISHASALLDKCTRTSISGYEIFRQSLASKLFLCLFMQGCYSSAFVYAELAVEQSRALAKEQSTSLRVAVSNLAMSYQAIGKYTDAEKLLREVLNATEEEPPGTCDEVQVNLSWVLYLQGQYKSAEDILANLIERNEQKMEGGDEVILKAYNNYGLVLWRQRNFDKAELVLRRLLMVRKKNYGQQHLSTLSCINNLSIVMQSREEWDEALEFCTEVYDGRFQIFGPKHHETLKAKANMIAVVQNMDPEAAETLTRELLTDYVELLGESHPETLTVQSNIAVILHKLNRFKEAELLVQKVFISRDATLGSNHPDTVASATHANELRQWLRETEGLTKAAVAAIA